MLYELAFPSGLLGTLSLGALYDIRMNMVAGAFWLLLSPTLAREMPFAGIVGGSIGIGHLIYFAYQYRRRRAIVNSMENVQCQI
jgi:hypothetical protein